MADDSRNVAVLIDFENLNDSQSLQSVVKLGSKYGKVVVKLAIGNFSAIGDNGQQRLQELGIQPVHQSTAGKGKNSSDMRMTIEAINLFHHPSISIDVFVLATSDVDFLPLAQWLRASGKSVIGAGSSSATTNWQTGVDEFVVVKEVKVEEEVTIASKEASAGNSSTKSVPPKPKTLSEEHRAVIDKAISRAFSDGTGPISNAEFLKTIREFDPKFSRQTHGFSSFRKVVQSIKRLRVPPEPKTGNFEIHLRKRKGKTST